MLGIARATVDLPLAFTETEEESFASRRATAAGEARGFTGGLGAVTEVPGASQSRVLVLEHSVAACYDTGGFLALRREVPAHSFASGLCWRKMLFACEKPAGFRS